MTRLVLLVVGLTLLVLAPMTSSAKDIIDNGKSQVCSIGGINLLQHVVCYRPSFWYYWIVIVLQIIRIIVGQHCMRKRERKDVFLYFRGLHETAVFHFLSMHEPSHSSWRLTHQSVKYNRSLLFSTQREKKCLWRRSPQRFGHKETKLQRAPGGDNRWIPAQSQSHRGKGSICIEWPQSTINNSRSLQLGYF